VGRLIKYTIYLIILVAIGLAGYSIFGDLTAPNEEFKEQITLPANAS